MKVFAVDVSGSMAAVTKEAVVAQITALRDPGETFMLLTFDMDVRTVGLLTAVSVDDLKSAAGGTNIEAVFNYLKDQGITPESLTIITDGQFSTNQYPAAFPTTYMIV